MNYIKAIETIKQYNKEYAVDNEILEAVCTIIDYCVDDWETDLKSEIVKLLIDIRKQLL